MTVHSAVPVRNPVAGDAEALEMRTHVIGHPAEILGDHFGIAGRVEQRAQAAIAIGEVGGAVLVGVVGPRKPLRQTATGDHRRLPGIEPDEFVIALGPPRKA